MTDEMLDVTSEEQFEKEVLQAELPVVVTFFHRWINITDENAYRPTFERFLAKDPGPAISSRGDACEIETKPK